MDEAVIFKQFDTRTRVPARASFHNSFHDSFHDAWKACLKAFHFFPEIIELGCSLDPIRDRRVRKTLISPK